MQSIIGLVIKELKRGSSVRVGRATEGFRRLTFEPSLFRKKSTLRISDDELLKLALEIAEWVSSDPRLGKALEFKLDYYGRQWIEVRSRRFSRQVSKIALPVEHLDLIKSVVVESLLPQESILNEMRDEKLAA